MGTTEEYNAMCDVVRGIVDQAVASLQGVGMTYEGALNLMMTQAAVRMEDGVTETKRLLQSLENNLEPPEG